MGKTIEFSPVQRHQHLMRYIKCLYDCARSIAPNAASESDDRKEYRKRLYKELAMAWAEIGKVSIELQMREFGEDIG